jgi:hypothetical protein
MRDTIRWVLLIFFVGYGIYCSQWAFQSASFSVPAEPFMSEIYKTRAMLLLPEAVLLLSVGVLFFICLKAGPDASHRREPQAGL